MPSAWTDREAGISVVESLVALAVFAMAGVGLLQLQAQSLKTFAVIEEKALAGMVAQNILTASTAMNSPPPVGRSSGVEMFANREWAWRKVVSAVASADMLRVDVEVLPSPVVSVVGEVPATAKAHGFVAVPDGAS